MKLNLERLEKPKERYGKIIARCPACAEIGKDSASDNLAIFANGNFACAVYQGDAEHSKRILQLAGAEMPARNVWQIPPPIRQPEDAPLPRLTTRQFGIMRHAIEALGKNPNRCAAIATRRGWNASTVRNAAMDCSMGWLVFDDELRKPAPVCPDGALCFIYRAGLKVRYIGPDGKKQLRYLKSEGLNHKSLWRGELITKATQTVWLTEGEPDCLRLMDMGIGEGGGNTEVACSLPDAGYTLRRDELDTLRGREVIFCPDNDVAGQKSVERLARVFHQQGIQFSIAKL